MTGISAPYEVPEDPELVIETDRHELGVCVDHLIRFLGNKKIVICRKISMPNALNPNRLK